MQGLLDVKEEDPCVARLVQPQKSTAAHILSMGSARAAVDADEHAMGRSMCCPEDWSRLSSQRASNTQWVVCQAKSAQGALLKRRCGRLHSGGRTHQGYAPLTAAMLFSFSVKIVTLVTLVPSTIAQPVQPTDGTLVFCQRYDEKDSSFEQCQDWCRYQDHCQLCKCRACSMCTACQSDEPEDLPFEMCQDWCSVREHCSHCKCKACTFCQPCKPASPDDVDFTECQEWCSDKAHCDLCKCKGCPSCQSQCTPHSRDDFDYLDCQPWCKAGTYNCPYCKCKQCDICKSQCMPWCKERSDCSADACNECEICKTTTGRCEPWCQQGNCRKEACAGCKACKIAADAVACDSGKRDDVLSEECLSWCSEKHGKDHCAYCACRRCPFCAAEAAKSIKDTGVPCPPFDTADSDTMRCEPFCKATSLLDHCDRCKCKACDFCPKRLDTGRPCLLASRSSSIADDSDTERCEPFCAFANAADHCKLCKCAGCSFCASVKAAAALPTSPAPRIAAARAPASEGGSAFSKSPPPSPAPPSPLAPPRASRPALRRYSRPPPPPAPSQPSALLSISLRQLHPPPAEPGAHHAQPSPPPPVLISPPQEDDSLLASKDEAAGFYGSEGDDTEGYFSNEDETEEQPEEWPIAYSLWSLLSLAVLVYVGRFLQRNVPVRLVQRLRSHRRLPTTDDDWRVDGSDEANDDSLLPIGHKPCSVDSTGFATQSSEYPRMLSSVPTKDGRAESDGIDVYDSLIAARQRTSRIDSEQQRFERSCHDDLACSGTRSWSTSWGDELSPVESRPAGACSATICAQTPANPAMPQPWHSPAYADTRSLDASAISQSRCGRRSSDVGLHAGLD